MSDGSITFPYPEYEEDVVAFFKLAAQPCWSDSDYRPEIASDMLGDERLFTLQNCPTSERS